MSQKTKQNKKDLPFKVLNINSKIMKSSPQQILLILLALDNSGSMNSVVDGITGKTSLDLLNQSVRKMFRAIQADSLLRTSVELEIITFNSDVKTVRPFSTLESNADVPTLCASGVTKIGEAICLGAEKIKARKEFHLRSGAANVVKPVLICLSDGLAYESSTESMEKAAKLCKSEDFHTVPVLIGAPGEDPAYLKELGEPLNVSQLALDDLFNGILCATTSTLTTAAEDSFRDLLASAISWTSVLEKNKA